MAPLIPMVQNSRTLLPPCVTASVQVPAPAAPLFEIPPLRPPQQVRSHRGAPPPGALRERCCRHGVDDDTAPPPGALRNPQRPRQTLVSLGYLPPPRPPLCAPASAPNLVE
ncbi:hypothetical protein DEO72_LG5g1304 [Vigna unguiculata]|uniref:Uncharacterized protein n=1 Tax=Vigna unguiculata TaxID=3917 RepID=A0A4D6LWH9_VIGUN|nr:hypothetical protein DEO72_LG5g1304 [Vigna unguiculata]